MFAESINIKFFRLEEIEKVTNSPGIYTWYGKPSFDEYDWKHTELSQFIKMFSNMMNKNRPIGLTSEVSSSFGLKWQGKLDEGSMERWTEKLNQHLLEEGLERSESINSIFEPLNNRKLLSHVLNEICPTYANPLYIGVAKNLKNRLMTHKNSLDSLFEEKPRNFSELYEQGSEFAHRAYGAGFKRTELIVGTIDFEELSSSIGTTNLSIDDLRQLAAVVEFVLNRKYRPILGRN